MDELVDLLDSYGSKTGKTAMKSVAHRDGLFHAAIHVWFYTKDGHLLLQQRTKNKDTFPLLWDVSVAGHIGAGEDILESAIREVQEEIGLKIHHEDLKKIGVFRSVQKHNQFLTDCEFHHTFVCELKIPLASLKKQESEVENLALIPISKFSKSLRNPNEGRKFVPHDMEYYETIISEITRVL